MDKQLKIKIIAGMIVLISLFCFVYLNTRNSEISEAETVELKTNVDKASDTAHENQEAPQIFKAGVVFLIKALVLSNK